MVRFSSLVLSASLLALSGCNMAPDFALPTQDVPDSFKASSAAEPSETSDGLPQKEGSWKKFDDAAFAQFGQGEWWKVFGDSRLDALMDAGLKHSPTLQAARARLSMSRAQAGVAESVLWPDITADSGVNRQRQSPANPNIPPGQSQKPFTMYRTGLGIDYGLDLFGRARGAAKAANERVEAQKALFAATRLTLQADIAQTYYTLLALNEEHAFLVRTVALRTETLALTRKRFELGEVSDLDVARAEGELAQSESELQSVAEQRSANEHALATLTGKTPAAFAMPECVITSGSTDACDLFSEPPVIPSGLPSSLLERRPDIAAAARELSARNQRIGVAKGAFFPSIDLSGSFGYESTTLGSLFDWSNRTWLLGPATGTFISLPVYTGGRNTANLLLSKAEYREQVASYRGTLLTAFKEVEDALVSVRTARERQLSQAKALDAGKRAYRIAKLQYENGYAPYLSLLDAERSLIAAARGEVQARGARYTSTITLIRALGGGWGEVKDGASRLPASDNNVADKPVTAKPTATKATPAAIAPSPAKQPPARLPRPWDKKADKQAETKPTTQPRPATATPKAAPKAVPTPPAAPAPLPFKARNPNKPVHGVVAPSLSGAATPEPAAAPSAAPAPFKVQGAR